MARFRLIGTLWLLGFSLLLGGCGFKLRTWELDSNISSAAIVDKAGMGNLTRDLTRAMTQAGVEILPAAAASAESAAEERPDVKLTLLDSQNERRSISVTDSARAAEYELLLGVNFGLADPAGQELIEPRWVRVQRIYRIDRNNLVGSNEEENLIRREMRTELTQQILRAINQITAGLSSDAEAGDPDAEPGIESGTESGTESETQAQATQSLVPG